MNAQIEKTMIETERFRLDMRYEKYRIAAAFLAASATVLGAAAAIAGVILGVAHFIR